MSDPPLCPGYPPRGRPGRSLTPRVLPSLSTGNASQISRAMSGRIFRVGDVEFIVSGVCIFARGKLRTALRRWTRMPSCMAGRGALRNAAPTVRRSEYTTRQRSGMFCGRIPRMPDTPDGQVQHSPRPGELPPFLQVTDISKTYRRQTALRGVSFMVSPGEIVGLVGPNGAGKSTTLRIICGLLRPDSGGVLIDGIDQRKEPARCRSRLGALIEAPACYPSLTAFDHLAYLARIRGCYDAGVLERVLADVGLQPRSKKTVRQFSLGMKQRLGIAMAILDSPGLLVLDEPMNGLDPIGMADFRERLRVLAARDQVAILVSSHLLHEIEQICHRVLFIRESRLINETTLDLDQIDAVSTIVLVTDDDAAAIELLRQQAFVQEAESGPEGIECRLAAGDVPEIAPLLVAAGIPIHAISPRKGTLEALYLSHYDGSRTRSIE